MIHPSQIQQLLMTYCLVGLVGSTTMKHSMALPQIKALLQRSYVMVYILLPTLIIAKTQGRVIQAMMGENKRVVS